MDHDLVRRVTAFLDLYHVMSLATLGPEGPHAANVFYARDELALFWVSEKDARHSRHIENDPRIAATIAPDYTDFGSIQGLQIHGTAQRIDDKHERLRLLRALEARYAFLGRLASLPGALRAAYARVQVYRLTPRTIVLIDNTRGFGHKEILTLADEAR